MQCSAHGACDECGTQDDLTEFHDEGGLLDILGLAGVDDEFLMTYIVRLIFKSICMGNISID